MVISNTDILKKDRSVNGNENQEEYTKDQKLSLG